MPKFRIDEVYPKQDIYPMIIGFENGYTTDHFQPKHSSLFINENNNKKVVATELDGIIYCGDEETEELGKTLILARNKDTGKVRLIEVGHANLKPVINIDSSVDQVGETSGLELSRKFGSKKQRQQMEQREKLKVNVKTVTEQMQQVTDNITEDKLDLSSYNKSDSDDFYVPPIDRAANRAEDVYDINKILTEEQYDVIYSEIEEKDYTSDMLPIVKNIVNSRKNMSPKHTVLAVYASCLLKLFTSVLKDLSKKGLVACDHSPTLNKILLTDFFTTTNGRRGRPSAYKDKTLCHALVFILLINDLKFELDQLCSDVKLTPNNASLKIRVTGASIINVNSKKVIQLKLPLNTKSTFRRKSAKF